MQLREQLERTMPGVKVSAEHYPPSSFATTLSGVITATQWAVIFCAFAGQTAEQMAVGTPFSPAVRAIQENRLSFAGGAWFVGSSLSASMLKTGAFEVTIRDAEGSDTTVWSGIKRGGRPPATMNEMQAIIDSLRMAGVGRPAPEPALSDDM